MKKAPKIIITMLLTLQMITALTFTAFADSFPDTDNIGERITEYVDEHEDTTAGMSVSVFDRSKILYQGFYGCSDIENNVPVDEETVMEWGSVSKLLVWISVMQLKEQGLISLDEDIKTYLPEDFSSKLKYKMPINMLNLMNHNAGFEEAIIGLFTGDESRIMPLDKMLLASEPRQIYEPGTVCAYSNWSTSLAAYVVQCVSGMPYEDYVKENIFIPLGMEHTSILPDCSDNEWVRNKRAELKIYDYFVQPITPSMTYINVYPSGACMSTADDMSRFAIALLNEGTPLFGNADTYREMFTPTDLFGNTDVGRIYHGFWGMEAYAVHVIGHSGNTAGCSASLLLDLENGVGMTVMTNQSGEIYYNNEMPRLLFGEYSGEYDPFTGTVQSPRAIFSGPLKIYGFMNIMAITPENNTGSSMIVRTDKDGPDRLEVQYSDYLIIDDSATYPHNISIGLYVLALFLAFFMLLIGVILFIAKRRGTLAKWTILTSGIQFIPVFILSAVVPTFFNYLQWPVWEYRAALMAIFAVLIANAFLIAYGIKNFRKASISKLRTILTLLSALLSSFGIIYWELFMFWAI